jgi:hypothetical protein
MKRRLLVKVLMLPVVLACYLLVSGVPAMAQSENCSNRTLVGDYGLTIEGTILDANAPIRGLVLQHYDGRGHITQVDHVVFGGYPPTSDWTPGTGTYTVNSDCTGSAVINSPSNPVPVNIHFVIVDHGKQIKQVVDANAVVASGIKVN